MAKLDSLPMSKAEILGKLHDALYDASRSLGSTDTILVGTTDAFNLVMLALLSMSNQRSAIFFVFLFTLVVVNILILLTFRNSREMREKLHYRQEKLYRDIELEEYFDESVIQNCRRRYSVWMILDVVLGVMVVLVALLVKFNRPPS